MSLGRTTTVALGCGIALLAAAIVVDPGIAEQVGMTEALAGIKNGYLLVAGAGVVALVYGSLVWLSWSASGVSQATPPDVETGTASVVPGSELDEALPELAGRRERAARPVEHRDWIRTRLRGDAVSTLARIRNVPEQRAVDAVAAGTWTDDRYATGFLGGEDAPGPRWYQRLWHGLRRRDSFSLRVRRTVDALTALEGAS